MNAAEMAECAAREWHAADPVRKALIVEGLFFQAWTDLALEFEPRVLALPINSDLLPGGVSIEQTLDEDGEEAEGAVRRIDNLTLAELRTAMAIQRGNILWENAHFKALACLLAFRSLDGAAEDELVSPGVHQ